MSSTVTATKGRGKSFYNQKFFGSDFSGQDLNHSDFRCCTVVDCNFSNADLSYANFEGANCRGANFTGTRCYRTNFKDAALAGSIFEPKDVFGMTITMSCETVDGAKVSRMWWYIWLMMAMRMKAPDEEAKIRLVQAIEPERYAGLRRLFDTREF